ncbi:1359_t:CDS:1, partial [Gigaspora margarita]
RSNWYVEDIEVGAEGKTKSEFEAKAKSKIEAEIEVENLISEISSNYKSAITANDYI